MTADPTGQGGWRDELLKSGLSAEEANDMLSGAPTPDWVTGDEARYRWQLVRELATDLAVTRDRDPASRRMFILMATRSFYSDESIPTRGPRSFETMVTVKRKRERHRGRWRRMHQLIRG